MYDQIARYYDLFHDELRDDIGWVLALASLADGQILELGCGSGRLLLPLARAGHTIYGLDNSQPMLDRATEKLSAERKAVQGRVTLGRGDMASFDLDREFALVIYSYNTIMHLEPKIMIESLSCARQHLKTNGTLFIDMANPLAAGQAPNDGLITLEGTRVDPDSGETVLQFASSRVDAESQVLHITWLYDALPASGGVVRRTVANGEYHYLYPHEIELNLRIAGLGLDALYGNYDKQPFDEQSERMLVLATAR